MSRIILESEFKWCLHLVSLLTKDCIINQLRLSDGTKHYTLWKEKEGHIGEVFVLECSLDGKYSLHSSYL